MIKQNKSLETNLCVRCGKAICLRQQDSPVSSMVEFIQEINIYITTGSAVTINNSYFNIVS
jgi:hypothetical protein